MKFGYTSLLIAAVILLAVGPAIDGLSAPLTRFLHGVLTGLSITCSVVGLVLYARSPKQG